MNSLNDAVEKSAHIFMARVVTQMEAVLRGEKSLRVAAAEIGIQPFELENLYYHKSLRRDC